MIRTFDLAQQYRSFYSKAAKVMESLQALADDGTKFNRLSIIESRAIFSKTFHALCSSFHPTLTLVELDRKHYGDTKYVTFYDLISKKRKHDAI